MKFRLLATSALVAAGLSGMVETASAQAKITPITVVVGGYHTQAFGYAGNQSGKITKLSSKTTTSVANTTTGAITTTTTTSSNTDPNKFTQYSDSEIWFGGRTTLANGITIGFDVQLEGNSSGDQIDESYLFVDGAFGRLVMGAENHTAYIMHVGAPNAGANAFQSFESDAIGLFILRPTAVSMMDTTQPKMNSSSFGGSFSDQTGVNQAGNDMQRVSYYTPRFFGLQAGVTYTPNMTEDTNTILDQNQSRTNGFGGALNYTNNFSGFDVKASAGIIYWPSIDGAVASPTSGASRSIKDWALGAQLGYTGFSGGASYRNYDNSGDPSNGYAWAVGGAYKTGAFAIALNYLESKVDGDNSISGQDKFQQIQLTGAYQMGPGIELFTSIFYLKFADGDSNDSANDNKGLGVASGIRLAF